MEWTHGAGVAQALVGSFLPTKVGEGIETVCVVKALLVLTMATFHLSVVPGRIGADELCAVCPAVWPVSYTHLDVYKRQLSPSVPN